MIAPRLKRRLLQHLRLRESWIIFFLLVVIMLNYPFIHIFNKASTLFGFPIFYLYLQAGWAISIFIIYLFTKAIPPDDDGEGKGEP